MEALQKNPEQLRQATEKFANMTPEVNNDSDGDFFCASVIYFNVSRGSFHFCALVFEGAREGK